MPFFVLSHHQNRNCRSLFIFSDTQTTKKTLKEPLLVIMSIDPNPKMKTLRMKYGLFRLTQQHHKKCLRNLFLKHYAPLVKKGYKPNKHWATHLSPDIMKELRVHLSWVRGGDVTHWTDEQIGRKIVDAYHKANVLPFLISEIRRRK